MTSPIKYPYQTDISELMTYDKAIRYLQTPHLHEDLPTTTNRMMYDDLINTIQHTQHNFVSHKHEYDDDNDSFENKQDEFAGDINAPNTITTHAGGTHFPQTPVPIQQVQQSPHYQHQYPDNLYSQITLMRQQQGVAEHLHFINQTHSTTNDNTSINTTEDTHHSHPPQSTDGKLNPNRFGSPTLLAESSSAFTNQSSISHVTHSDIASTAHSPKTMVKTSLYTTASNAVSPTPTVRSHDRNHDRVYLTVLRLPIKLHRLRDLTFALDHNFPPSDFLCPVCCNTACICQEPIDFDYVCHPTCPLYRTKYTEKQWSDKIRDFNPQKYNIFDDNRFHFLPHHKSSTRDDTTDPYRTTSQVQLDSYRNTSRGENQNSHDVWCFEFDHSHGCPFTLVNSLGSLVKGYDFNTTHCNFAHCNFQPKDDQNSNPVSNIHPQHENCTNNMDHLKKVVFVGQLPLYLFNTHLTQNDREYIEELLYFYNIIIVKVDERIQYQHINFLSQLTSIQQLNSSIYSNVYGASIHLNVNQDGGNSDNNSDCIHVTNTSRALQSSLLPSSPQSPHSLPREHVIDSFANSDFTNDQLTQFFYNNEDFSHFPDPFFTTLSLDTSGFSPNHHTMDQLWQAFFSLNINYATAIQSIATPTSLVLILQIGLSLLPLLQRQKMQISICFRLSAFCASEFFKVIGPYRAIILRSVLSSNTLLVNNANIISHFLSSARRCVEITFKKLDDYYAIQSAGGVCNVYIVDGQSDVYNLIHTLPKPNHPTQFERFLTQSLNTPENASTNPEFSHPSLKMKQTRDIIFISIAHGVEGIYNALKNYLTIYYAQPEPRKELCVFDFCESSTYHLIFTIYQAILQDCPSYEEWPYFKKDIVLQLLKHNCIPINTTANPTTPNNLKQYSLPSQTSSASLIGTARLSSMNNLYSAGNTTNTNTHVQYFQQHINFLNSLILICDIIYELGPNYIPINLHSASTNTYHAISVLQLSDVIILGPKSPQTILPLITATSTKPSAIISSERLLLNYNGVYAINTLNAVHLQSLLYYFTIHTDPHRSLLNHVNHTMRYAQVLSKTSIYHNLYMLPYLLHSRHRDEQKTAISLGFNQLKIVFVRNDFKVINIPAVISGYKQCTHRLIMLGYDGTLVESSIDNSSKTAVDLGTKIPQQDNNQLPTKLSEALKVLTSDPNNAVFVISSRSKLNLYAIFQDLPEIGLICESGLLIKYPQRLQQYITNNINSIQSPSETHNTQDLEKKINEGEYDLSSIISPTSSLQPPTTANNSSGDSNKPLCLTTSQHIPLPPQWHYIIEPFDTKFIDLCYEIMYEYCSHTESSAIIRQDYSISWTYSSDTQLGSWQANEMQKVLTNSLKAANISDIMVSHQQNTCTVLVQHVKVTKGAALNHLLRALYGELLLPPISANIAASATSNIAAATITAGCLYNMSLYPPEGLLIAAAPIRVLPQPFVLIVGNNGESMFHLVDSYPQLTRYKNTYNETIRDHSQYLLQPSSGTTSAMHSNPAYNITTKTDTIDTMSPIGENNTPEGGQWSDINHKSKSANRMKLSSHSLIDSAGSNKDEDDEPLTPSFSSLGKALVINTVNNTPKKQHSHYQSSRLITSVLNSNSNRDKTLIGDYNFDNHDDSNARNISTFAFRDDNNISASQQGSQPLPPPQQQQLPPPPQPPPQQASKLKLKQSTSYVNLRGNNNLLAAIGALNERTPSSLTFKNEEDAPYQGHVSFAHQPIAAFASQLSLTHANIHDDDISQENESNGQFNHNIDYSSSCLPFFKTKLATITPNDVCIVSKPVPRLSCPTPSRRPVFKPFILTCTVGLKSSQANCYFSDESHVLSMLDALCAVVTEQEQSNTGIPITTALPTATTKTTVTSTSFDTNTNNALCPINLTLNLPALAAFAKKQSNGVPELYRPPTNIISLQSSINHPSGGPGVVETMKYQHSHNNLPSYNTTNHPHNSTSMVNLASASHTHILRPPYNQ